MRIIGADLTAVDVPYRPELGQIATAGLVLNGARHLIVELHTDEGISGLGEAVPRPSVYGETLDGLRAALETLLIPPILGLAPWETERAWQRWERVVGNNTAKSALDVALHDIVGKAAGLPIHRLLGGWQTDRIQLSMAIALSSVDEMVRQAEQAVAAGYRAIKLKVGKDVAGDLRAVQAVRAAIGDAPMLYVDANGGYSRADALRAARGFERSAVALFEEPLPAWDADGRARLARMIDTPMLIDESASHPAGVLREIVAGTAGAISVRAPRSGFTISRRIVGLAEAANVPCLVGSHRELGIGIAANAHLAAGFCAMRYPAELGTSVYLEDSLLEEPLEIVDGFLRLPTGPGLGVSLDRDRVARYRVWASAIGKAV